MLVPETLTVMHIRASNFVGGPEKQILEHFICLDTKKFKPIIGTFSFSNEIDPLGRAAKSLGFLHVCLSGRILMGPLAVYRLRQTIKEHRISILCTHGYKPNVYGILATFFLAVPVIAISRGWTWESTKIRLYESIDRFFLKFNKHIVAVSHGQKEKIVKYGINPDRVQVIHNAINLKNTMSQTDDYRRQNGLDSNSIIVASAGRLSPEKNQSAMIQVARMVTSRHDNVIFVIFGEGFLRAELEKQIEINGLTNKFLLPGFRSDLPQLMPQIDIFMLPSFTEGLPNVALEAFANKKPVVATAVGGTPEVVQDKISGYLTTPEDINGMAEAVEQLINNPNLRHQMGEAGYAYISEHFGFEAQTKKYEELYVRAVAESRRHGGAQLKVRY